MPLSNMSKNNIEPAKNMSGSPNNLDKIILGDVNSENIVYKKECGLFDVRQCPYFIENGNVVFPPFPGKGIKSTIILF